MAVALLGLLTIVSLLPRFTVSLVAAPPTKIIGHHELHSFVEYINSSWHCPQITTLPQISCGCDLPHTLRCRGDASSLPHTIFTLTEDLVGREVSLLDLAIHNISHLPIRAFEHLQLLGLVISSGALDELYPETFLGIEGSLAALGLPHNFLSGVPAEALQPLARLQRLDISDNTIEILPSRSFPTLIQLDSLSLAGNKIRIIQSEAFVRLPKLRTLNLSRNLLDASQISTHSLWGLHEINELNLRENLLKGTLSSNFITGGGKSLTVLNLSHNSITSISKGALQSYTNLHILDLTHNFIDVIEDNALQHLTGLRELLLSHNRIVGVSGQSFSHLTKLSTLGLADNALLTITADLVHNLPNLRTLNLAANDISVIQPQVFNSTPHLEHLILSDNPLHCDCSLHWLRDWLRSSLREEDKRGPVCATPLHLQNAPLVELNLPDLSCDKSYQDYHELYPDYYHDAPDFRVSEAEVELQLSRWTSNGYQLIWRVDEKAFPYACEAVFVYEVQMLKDGKHQLLTEKVDTNCSSQSMRDPERVSVTVPGDVLRIGSTYRYCLVLLEYGTGDQEGFLPGCSEPITLKAPPPNLPSPTVIPPLVNSLTAGEQAGSLLVHSRIRSFERNCTYTIVLIHEMKIAATHQLNCSQPRHSFSGLEPGNYIICIKPDNVPVLAHNLELLEHSLKVARNATSTLHESFPACTIPTVLRGMESRWYSSRLLVLLFVLPGLALIITLYVIGRKIYKGGGVPWKWDPRATKSAKYFLYTGESSLSLDPTVTSSIPEITTNL